MVGGGWKLRYPRINKCSLYQDCLIPPPMRWFPSRKKVFNVIGDWDPEYLFRIFPHRLNVSIWYNRKRKGYVIIAPRSYAETVERIFLKKFRYNSSKDVWQRRVNRMKQRKEGYSEAPGVEVVVAETKVPRKEGFHAKKEKKEKTKGSK